MSTSLTRQPIPNRRESVRRVARSPRTRDRVWHVTLLVPAAVLAAAALLFDVRFTQASGLFTATAITTGLTFSMATTFWTKSVEARRDPDRALDASVLNTLDRNRNDLIWTVAVGLLATAWLAGVSIFDAGPKGAAPIITAVSAFLVIYLLTLVGNALRNFARAVLLVR